jgi:drug/metabolite transporter (DMT)-like permease
MKIVPLPGPGDRHRLGAIGLAIVGFGLFSVSDCIIKLMSAHYTLAQMVFFNALFAMIPILGLAAFHGGASALVTRRPMVQLVRGLCGMTIGLGAYYAFGRMPMADVYAILFAAPLIIAGISAVFLRERLDRWEWTAVLVGFAGVLEMLRPSGDSFNEGAVAAFVGAMAFAGSALIVRHYGRHEQPASFPFYGCVLGVTVMGCLLPWYWVTPTWADLGLNAAGGLSAGAGLSCMLNAFRLAPPPIVAPFQYSQMVWGLVFGWLMFGDVPGLDLLLGAAVVVGSGLFLLMYERRRSRS